jgi:putative flippase GtrA
MRPSASAIDAPTARKIGNDGFFRRPCGEGHGEREGLLQGDSGRPGLDARHRRAADEVKFFESSGLHCPHEIEDCLEKILASQSFPDAVVDCKRSAAQAAPRCGESLSAQILRYVGCSGLAALVNFVAGSILVDCFGLASPWLFSIAVAAAYGLGMAVNLLLNRRYTFASDRTQIEQARTFAAVALSSLVLTTAVAALARAGLIQAIGGDGPIQILPNHPAAPEMLSRVFAIGVGAVYSFVLHKYFTFYRGIRWPLLRLAHSLHLGGSSG